MLKMKEAYLNEKSNPIKSLRVQVEKKPSVLFSICCFFIGAVLSGAFANGVSLPICPSLAAAFTPFYGSLVYAGALVSYFFTGTIVDFSLEIVAIPIIVLVKKFILGEVNFAEKVIFKSIFCFSIYVISGVFALLVTEMSLTFLASIFFRAIISGVFTYFISGLSKEFSENGAICVTGESSVSLSIIYILTTASLCGVNITGFSIARIFGVIMILIACRKKGIYGGCLVGALTSFAIIIGESGASYNFDMIRATAILSCSAIIAGYFSSKSQFIVAISFFLASFVLTLFVGEIQSGIYIVTDVLIGAVAFYIVPEKIYIDLLGFVAKENNGLMRFERDNLRFISCSIEDIERTSSKVAEILIPKSQSVSFDKLEVNDDEHEKVLKEKRDAIVQRKIWQAFSDQFNSTEEILSDISTKMDRNSTADEKLSSEANLLVEKFTNLNSSTIVFCNNSSNLFISSVISGDITDFSGEKIAALTEKISDLTDRELEMPEVFKVQNLTKLCWHEQANFTVSFGKACANGRETVSGDNSEIINDGFGKMYFVISDGMGSGERAAVESGMTIKLLRVLIKSGFCIKSAVKIINRTMIAKSYDEVFSTLDIACIDIFTGKLSLYKFGGATSFVKINGKLDTINDISTPLGIFTEIEVKERSLQLSARDKIVLTSDGITDECTETIVSLLKNDSHSAQRTADEIVNCAVKMQKYENNDDKTVLVAELF